MGGRGSSSMSASADTSYWGEHRPGNPADGAATADRLSSGEFFPSDYLEHPEWYLPEVIGSLERSDKGARETVQVLRSVQSKPNAEVTVYRGMPGNTLNEGDWVTLSKSYAEEYAGDGPYSGGSDSRVVSFTARASELSFDGDSLYEFGYWGKRQIARR